MSVSPLHVVVLDDRSRFALHVWRYLSRSIGFGIGDVPRSGVVDGGRPPEEGGGGRERANVRGKQLRRRLETPAGDAIIWWIDILGAANWKADLRSVLAEAKDPRRRVFLVDVRGDASPAKREFWIDALEELERQRGALDRDTVWLVSSYGVGSRRYNLRKGGKLELEVQPKNADTLQKLAARLWSAGKPAKPRGTAAARTSRKALHILVTGAGFEMKNRTWGEIRPLGIPATAELMETAYEDAVWKAGARRPGARSGRFQLPIPPSWTGREEQILFQAATRGNLDSLWNDLLEIVIEKARDRSGGAHSSSLSSQLKTLNDERQARESFRSSFLGDDWGLLTQVLDAADLPWDVWLTTNYTHFVDRALALRSREARAGEDAGAPWQIISIAKEAEALLRRLFFDRQEDRPRSVAAERFIFKLHGDLAHLSTMAVAGYDKELTSPLIHSVDSLHWLYEVAKRWIERASEHRGRVWWHVVGHSLQDKVLVRAMLDVFENQASSSRHSVLFVNPSAKEELRRIDPRLRKHGTWKAHNCAADQWLAMLVKFYRAQGRIWTPGPGKEELRDAVLATVP